MPAIDELLISYQNGVENWLGSGSRPDWAMVEAELDWADGLARAWSPVSHLNSVADNGALREAYNEGLERLTEHENWRQHHPGIFLAYQELRQSPQFEELSPVQQRIIELELRDFFLAGIELPHEEQAVYRELVLRMSKLGSLFGENLLDATRAWTKRIPGCRPTAGLTRSRIEPAGRAGPLARQGRLAGRSQPSLVQCDNDLRGRPGIEGRGLYRLCHPGLRPGADGRSVGQCSPDRRTALAAASNGPSAWI